MIESQLSRTIKKIAKRLKGFAAAVALLNSVIWVGADNDRAQAYAHLQDRPKIEVRVPTMVLQHEYGQMKASVLDLCVMGERIYLKSGEKEICLDNSSQEFASKENSHCSYPKWVRPSTEIRQKVEYCKRKRPSRGKYSGPRCLELGTEEKIIPLNYVIKTVEVKNSNENYKQQNPQKKERVIARENYLIPQCN